MSVLSINVIYGRLSSCR